MLLFASMLLFHSARHVRTSSTPRVQIPLKTLTYRPLGHMVSARGANIIEYLYLQTTCEHGVRPGSKYH